MRPWKKTYEDALGRIEKTEIWDLEGAGSAPYSSVKATFNGRDQPTLIRRYSGGDSSTIFQDTTFTYDGHGRQATKHLPEFNSNAITGWTYNADDTVASVTDPRGALTTYEYGHTDDPASSEYRGLLTKVLYTAPNSSIPDPTDIVFTYDPAGNRTFMSDGTGNLTYTYDELSRLKTETKNFADTLSSAPSGGYVLAYNYGAAGGLKSMTGPFGHEVNFALDAVGRITAVGDANSLTAYASSVTHRSFGGLKSALLSSTDPIAISVTYDNALRPATYEANSAANSSKLHHASYVYQKDGMLESIDNLADPKFDQLNKYDFAGRLKVNAVGTNGLANPFAQSLAYNAFDNLTYRVNSSYGNGPVSFSATYANNRKTFGGSSDLYDAAGNVTSSTQSSPTHNIFRRFDASGRQARWEEFGPRGDTVRKGGETTFDGDGRPVKICELTQSATGGVWGSWYSSAEYSIYSSVTGQKVTSVSGYGAHYRTHVYLGTARIADERNGDVWFNVTDPLSGSTRETDGTGAVPLGDEQETRNELAQLGTSVSITNPITMPPPNYEQGGYVGSAEAGCTDPDTRMPIPCDVLTSLENYKRGISPQEKKKKKKPPTLKRPSKKKLNKRKKRAAKARKKDSAVFDNEADSPADWRIWIMPGEEGYAKRIDDAASFASSSPECANAFREAGATPVSEQRGNTTFVTEKVFDVPDFDDFWAPDDGGQYADALRAKLAQSKKPSSLLGVSKSTVADITYVGPYVNRRYVAITNSGLKGELISLEEAVVHGLLHSGGVPPKSDQTTGEFLLSIEPPDLRYLGEKYENVKKHCLKRQ